MCRLLAYVSPRHVAIDDLLEDGEFFNFAELSTLHRDGWGMAWLTNSPTGGDVESVRSIHRALDDVDFYNFGGTPLGRAGVIHLRWASTGMDVCEVNTHPFVFDGVAFAHNGFIPNSELLLDQLSHESISRLEGDTDSELYFALIRRRINEAGDVVAGIRRAIEDVRSLSPLSSLNAILLSSELLVAIQGQGETPVPFESLRAAVSHPHKLPPGHDEDYYKLRYRKQGDSLIISSTGIGDDEWELLKKDSITVVDLRDNVVGTYSLTDATPWKTFSLNSTLGETNSRNEPQ